MSDPGSPAKRPGAGDEAGDEARDGGPGGSPDPAAAWSRSVPYRSHLRVYEPASAVRPAGGPAPRAVDPVAEPAAAFQRLIATPPVLAPADGDAAYVLTAGDQEFWCPVDERHRCWEALRRAGGDGAGLLALSFGRAQVGDATDAYEAWRAARPWAVPHVLTSAWHVPLRWFVLFEPAERRAVAGPEPSVVYRTTMSAARRRLSKAHALLRRRAPDERLTEAVRDLGAWINEFHPRGVVELDHGGLVRLLGFPRVRRDDSVAQVAAFLAALDEGRDTEAWTGYRVLLDRWRRVQQLSRAS